MSPKFQIHVSLLKFAIFIHFIAFILVAYIGFIFTNNISDAFLKKIFDSKSLWMETLAKDSMAKAKSVWFDFRANYNIYLNDPEYMGLFMQNIFRSISKRQDTLLHSITWLNDKFQVVASVSHDHYLTRQEGDLRVNTNIPEFANIGAIENIYDGEMVTGSPVFDLFGVGTNVMTVYFAAGEVQSRKGYLIVAINMDYLCEKASQIASIKESIYLLDNKNRNLCSGDNMQDDRPQSLQKLTNKKNQYIDMSTEIQELPFIFKVSFKKHDDNEKIGKDIISKFIMYLILIYILTLVPFLLFVSQINAFYSEMKILLSKNTKKWSHERFRKRKKLQLIYEYCDSFILIFDFIRRNSVLTEKNKRKERDIKILKEKEELLRYIAETAVLDNDEMFNRLDNLMIIDREKTRAIDYFSKDLERLSERVNLLRNRICKILLYTKKIKNEKENCLSMLQNANLKCNELTNQITRDKKEMLSTLADVNHELRTPLNGIIGFLDLLEFHSSEFSSEAKRMLLLTRRAASFLKRIVDDILNVFQLESSDILPLHKEKIDIKRLINDCIDLMNIEAKEKGVLLRSNLSCTEENIVLIADPCRITQAIINGIGNSIKFISKGDTVSLFTRLRDKNFEIVILDNGPGISDSEMNIVFRRNRRGKSKSSIGGLGLGLPLIKKIMTAHNGDVSLVSNPGLGTELSLIFPLL